MAQNIVHSVELNMKSYILDLLIICSLVYRLEFPLIPDLLGSCKVSPIYFGSLKYLHAAVLQTMEVAAI